MIFNKSLLAAGVASLASVASAGLVSFSVPSTIVPGQKFTASFVENNATKTKDVAVAIGIAQSPTFVTVGGVGTELLTKQILTNTDITPSPETVEIEATLPDWFEKGQAVLVASVYGVVGARLSPFVTNYNVTLTVGDTASTETVKSGDALKLL